TASESARCGWGFGLRQGNCASRPDDGLDGGGVSDVPHAPLARLARDIHDAAGSDAAAALHGVGDGVGFGVAGDAGSGPGVVAATGGDGVGAGPGLPAAAATLREDARVVYADAVRIGAVHVGEAGPTRVVGVVVPLVVPPSRAVPGEAARAAGVAAVVAHAPEALVGADDEGAHLATGAIPHLRQPGGPFDMPIVTVRPGHGSHASTPNGLKVTARRTYTAMKVTIGRRILNGFIRAAPRCSRSPRGCRRRGRW